MIDQSFFRPAEVDRLLADSSKAKSKLGWEPKVSFEELIEMMVHADLELVAASADRGGESLNRTTRVAPPSG